MRTLIGWLAVSFVTASCLAQQAEPVKNVGGAPRGADADVAGGRILTPGEVLVEGERIVASGAHVDRPADARVLDLGDTTLMPGLIDAHVHLFLHPGAEEMQTVRESVPERTLMAAGARRLT